tara:strand:- start:1472 stop:1747 length:276 start_codon:yes stop_codon:yes gene_type:complete
MKYILPRYNLEWLEEKLTFGFRNKKSAPAPTPEPVKSEAEVKADANRDRTLRYEEEVEKNQTVAGKRRRRGKTLLISKGNTEKGLSDTLGG